MEIQKYTSNTTQQIWRVYTFTQKCDYKSMLNTFVHNNSSSFCCMWGQDINKEILFALNWHLTRAENQWLCLGNILSVSSIQRKTSSSNPPGQFSAFERNCWRFQSRDLGMIGGCTAPPRGTPGPAEYAESGLMRKHQANKEIQVCYLLTVELKHLVLSNTHLLMSSVFKFFACYIVAKCSFTVIEPLITENTRITWTARQFTV